MSDSCGNLCHIAKCFESATTGTTVPHDDCTPGKFESTIKDKETEWQNATGKSTVDVCCGEISTTSTTNTQETTTQSKGSPAHLPLSLLLAFGIFMTLVLSFFH